MYKIKTGLLSAIDGCCAHNTVSLSAYTHTRTYIHIYVYVYVCVYIHIYVKVCIYIHKELIRIICRVFVCEFAYLLNVTCNAQTATCGTLGPCVVTHKVATD